MPNKKGIAKKYLAKKVGSLVSKVRGGRRLNS